MLIATSAAALQSQNDGRTRSSCNPDSTVDKAYQSAEVQKPGAGRHGTATQTERLGESSQCGQLGAPQTAEFQLLITAGLTLSVPCPSHLGQLSRLYTFQSQPNACVRTAAVTNTSRNLIFPAIKHLKSAACRALSRILSVERSADSSTLTNPAGPGIVPLVRCLLLRTLKRALPRTNAKWASRLPD